jgi:predicted membrane protein
MSSYKLNLIGSLRSMAEMLRGFSVSFMAAALGFGVFDLMLSRERARLLRRPSLINIIWLASMTAVSLRYFFIVPTSFLAVALFIFVLVWLTLPADGTTGHS